MTTPPAPVVSERHEAAFFKLLSSNVAVTLSNLLRDVAIAIAFGASTVTDNFFLAISIPIFLVTVASGAWRSVVLPLLARVLRQGQGAFTRVVQRLSGLSIGGIGLIAVVLLLFAAAALLGGWTGAPSPEAGAVSLPAFTMLVIPMYCLVAFTELSQAPLQARNRLFVPSLTRVGLPVGLIAGALLLGDRLGVLALVPGGTFGALAGAGVIGMLLAREGMLPGRASEPLPADVRHDLVLNFRALVIATSITYLSPLIGQWMASGLGPGAVSYLGYANRLTTGAIMMVTGSLAPVLLGFYASQVAGGGIGAVRGAFVSLSQVFAWIGCGMTLAAWLLSDYLVALVYQHGEFTSGDAQAVRVLVDCYALGFPFILAALASNTLISALSRNAVFVPICVALLVATIVANFVMMTWFGVAGIALATSLVYGLSLVLLNRYLQSAGGLSLTMFEWLHIAMPFGILALAGLAPLWFGVRVYADLWLPDLLEAALVLAVFVGLAVLANRAVLRAYLAPVLAARRARRQPAKD